MYVPKQTQNQKFWQTEKDDVIESTHQVKDGWLQFEYKGKTAYANVFSYQVQHQLKRKPKRKRSK